MVQKGITSSFLANKDKEMLKSIKDKVATKDESMKKSSILEPDNSKKEQISSFQSKASQVLQQAKAKAATTEQPVSTLPTLTERFNSTVGTDTEKIKRYAQLTASFKEQGFDSTQAAEKAINEISGSVIPTQTPGGVKQQVSQTGTEQVVQKDGTTIQPQIQQTTKVLHSPQELQSIASQIENEQDPEKKGLLIAQQAKMLSENESLISKGAKDISLMGIASEDPITKTQSANLLKSRLAPYTSALNAMTDAIQANEKLVQYNEAALGRKLTAEENEKNRQMQQALQRESQSFQKEIQTMNNSFQEEQNRLNRELQKEANQEAKKQAIADYNNKIAEAALTKEKEAMEIKDNLYKELRDLTNEADDSEIGKSYNSARIAVNNIANVGFKTDENGNLIVDAKGSPIFKDNIPANAVVTAITNIKKAYDSSQVTDQEFSTQMGAMASVLGTTFEGLNKIAGDGAALSNLINSVTGHDTQEFRREILGKALNEVLGSYNGSRAAYNNLYFQKVQTLDSKAFGNQLRQTTIDQLQKDFLERRGLSESGNINNLGKADYGQNSPIKGLSKESYDLNKDFWNAPLY